MVVTRLANTLLLLALLLATGTHWMVLQSVAWTTMLATNLRSGSLDQAVERTFDGQHPCCLCKQIAAARKSEKKAEFSSQAHRFEFLPLAPRLAFCAPTQCWEVLWAEPCAQTVGHTPPTPPPRGLLA